MAKVFSEGPVAQHGLRRRPSEPENVGSNPTGPAYFEMYLFMHKTKIEDFMEKAPEANVLVMLAVLTI